MDGVARFWEIFKDIQLDLLLFILLVFFAFKFKDIIELWIRLGSLRAERLRTAKELLELSNNDNTTEMMIIKEQMRSHAVKIATGLRTDKGRELYCYLSVKFGLRELTGVHKLVQFVNIKDGVFFLDKSAINSKRWRVSTFILMAIFICVYLSVIYKSSEGMNLSWLFLLANVFWVGFYLYWSNNIMPDTPQIKNIQRLLQLADMKEYNQFLKGDYPPANETGNDNS